MANDIKSVIYTDNFGKQYNCGVSAAVFVQAGADLAPKIGGADYTGAPRLDPMPRNLRPRGVYVSNGVKKRFVICLDPTASLLIGPETQIDLPDGGGVTTTYTVGNTRAEKFRFYRNPAG